MTKKRKQQDGDAMIDDLLTDVEIRSGGSSGYQELLARARREPVQPRCIVLAEHPTLQ